MQPGSGFGALRSRLVDAIDRQLAAAEADGLRPEDIGDPAEVAARVTATLTPRHPTARLVGPCYDEASLARWLGISLQALEQRRKTRQVLACRTAAGRWVYPALQFTANRDTLPQLSELITILAGVPDNQGERWWRAARWLAAPNPDLPDQTSAADWLRRGSDPDLVLRAARADAHRWAA